MKLRIKKLSPTARIPTRATQKSAGLDLYADEKVRLYRGIRRLIKTGIVIALPPGTEGQIRPRSGLAVKHGITVLNSPGTIDEDYRGEVKVCLVNLGENSIDIEPGMRIAQLVIAKVCLPKLKEVDKLDNTSRGTGGFGHTGV